jgi:hypothetical protein
VVCALETSVCAYTSKSCFFPLKVGWVRPKRGCLLTLAYYAFPRWYEFGEWRWNDILTGENRWIRRKTCPSATLSTTNPTWIDPGVNSGLRGERPETTDLSHARPRHGVTTQNNNIVTSITLTYLLPWDIVGPLCSAETLTWNRMGLRTAQWSYVKLFSQVAFNAV